VQVRGAYLASWDAYAHAMRTLDPTGLDCCHADTTLATLYRTVDEHLRTRRKVRVAVTHDLHVAFLGPDRAIVTDHVVDDSVAFDADTGQGLEQPAHLAQLLQFTLERREGVWKVVLTVGY